MFHIVLVEPEIPANTGNISRTCAVTGASLHLVRPLGFSTDDAHLKRAGLDYWHALDLHYYDSFDALRAAHPDARYWYATTHAAHSYADTSFRDGDFLVFGKETAGLPKALLAENAAQCIRIPMGGGLRSLNLSNAVAVVLYEALRQGGFVGLE
ncbi:MAG: tRNA (cytidine(34)-2'-O)-methyltransferase [Clostridiales bacterium]|nr:tRNA (cytidine(34)-2'-O)-methyltransferase [Clostridiales bacterium]